MPDPLMIITGGGRGIGAATARLAAAAGYRLCLTFRERADEAHGLAGTLGRDSFALRCDVAEPDDVAALFAAVDQRHGRPDVLVNNAGIVAPRARVDAIDDARIQRMFAVNVFGTMACARAAVLRMSTRHGGRGGAIVNVSSVASRLGSPGEYVDYAASKAAVDAFTLGLGREVAAEGVRVNAVRPGLIHTDIHASGGEPDRIARLVDAVPQRRGGQADEVAAAILWLASPAASYVNGSLLDVSGGR